MIKINLKGGLGNQLFQYALGRHLAIIHKTSLMFDINSFTDDPLREYRLNAFNIFGQPDKASLNPIRHFFRRKFGAIKENGFEFQPEILKTPDNSFLDGYWQSEKYFSAIQEIIRSDLTLINPIPQDLIPLKNKITSSNSVSIHVRRGDYDSNPTTTAFHGLCSIDWYKNAANEFTKTNEEFHFFIFSDDYDWVKENLRLDSPTTFIKPSANGDEAQDMYLMSLCKHNIIANSSFSWWAAWLNLNKSKKVIAPKRWFAQNTHNTSDLIPTEWIKL